MYAATEGRPDDALEAVSVAGALEALGFTTEIMEVALDLASIETLPSRRPLLVFNLVDAINCDGCFAPLVPARLDALGIAYTGCSTSALFASLQGWDQTEARPCRFAYPGVVYRWDGA